MIELKTLNEQDPLKRMVEKETGQQEFSPMDPPDAYKPPVLEEVPYYMLHPVLQDLTDEHLEFIKELETFEKHLNNIKESGINTKTNKALGHFFSYLDGYIFPHGDKEDKLLFPPLQKQLLKSGEHSNGPEPTTAVDMLEDDHKTAAQLAAVSFNFFGLLSRLTEAKSQAEVLDTVLELSLALVEIYRLHFFREEKVLFPLAQKYMREEDWKEISKAWKFPKVKGQA